MNDTTEIHLTRGLVARISSADLALVSPIRWHAQKGRGTYYAAARCEGRKIYMHRLITACPPGLVVDHADGDGLHNVRENLRITTHAHNAANCGAFGIVAYRGVVKVRGRFRARLNDRHLGYFATAEEAARAYDAAILAAYGPFAWLNFPDLRPPDGLTPPPDQPVPF